MTISDVVVIADLYREISYHPINTEVRFGCDCGCGGDTYTIDEWEEEFEDLDRMNERLETLCVEFNIEL